MAERSQINIAILGLGVIGTGVVGALLEKQEAYRKRLGIPLAIRRILVRDLEKQRGLGLEPGILTTDSTVVFGDDSLDIVVEVMGDEHPAYDYAASALSQGRFVVTANKMVMAIHGARLLSLAREHGVDILYEASVGGGIPIISLLKRDLSANRIQGLTAIINGTTNFILTQMYEEGLDFGEALRQAQELGYAEADPTLDVDGHDAAYKLAVLASLAFSTDVQPDMVHREGIAGLSTRDFRYARDLGYVIKLLATARLLNGALQMRVHPALLAAGQQLAKVDGVLNAVQVEGDLAGAILFQGAGAGPAATASAVIADILEAADRIIQGTTRSSGRRHTVKHILQPIAALVSRYYIRLEVADRPGVFAEIARCFGDRKVSIASAIQQEANPDVSTAEIVIMTHPALEEDLQASIRDVRALGVVAEVGSLLRVES